MLITLGVGIIIPALLFTRFDDLYNPPQTVTKKNTVELAQILLKEDLNITRLKQTKENHILIERLPDSQMDYNHEESYLNHIPINNLKEVETEEYKHEESYLNHIPIKELQKVIRSNYRHEESYLNHIPIKGLKNIPKEDYEHRESYLNHIPISELEDGSGDDYSHESSYINNIKIEYFGEK